MPTCAFHIAILFLIFLVLLQIFHLNYVRSLSWKWWFRLFIIASCIDVGSTIFALYVMDMPWSEETNIIVGMLGSVIGFTVALICWNLVVVGIYYAAGMTCRNETARLGFSMLLYGTIFFRTLAAWANVFQPAAGIDLSFLFTIR